MKYSLLSNKFVISKDEVIDIDPVFTKKKVLANSFLYYDNKIDIFEYNFEGTTVIILGYILDITDYNKNTEEISKKISSVFKEDVKTEFYDYIDFLNGRYIILIDNNENLEIYTDATSSRPIFYWENELFASHEVILRDIVNNTKNKKLIKNYTVNGFMDATNTKDIYKFNCNNYFSMEKQKFHRYYPRKDQKVLSLEKIYSNTKPYIDEQVKWLDKNYNEVYASLTGGYDSKVTMSFLKAIKNKVSFFTYMVDLATKENGHGKDIYEKDEIIVDRLVDNFDVKHRYFYFKDYSITDDFSENYKNNFSSKHSIELANLIRKEFNPNAIHVKSTIYEMAKLPFLLEQFDYYKKDDLYRATLKWAPMNLRNKTKLTREIFDGYIVRSKYNEITKYKYNFLMMFYWETRMGNWHSNITQETEEIIETFVFVNNRYILNQFMSMDINVRKKNRLLTKYIEGNWPFLNYQVPNNLDTLNNKTRNDSVIFSNTGKLKISEFQNLNIKSNIDGFLIKPNEGILLKEDRIIMNLENNTTETINFLITSFYKHTEKNIFIVLNNKKYSINGFFNGFNAKLQKEDTITIEYVYTNDFEAKSWNDAGRLLIEEIE